MTPMKALPLDLTLTVHKTSKKLRLELDAPGLGVNRQVFTRPWQSEDNAALNELVADIDRLQGQTHASEPETQKVSLARIEAKGLKLWALLPEELRGLLWSLRGPRGMVRNLLIQSDELDIPWELVKLESRKSDRRVVSGPFQCEANAHSPMHNGNPVKLDQWVKRIALVGREDDPLAECEEELDAVRRIAGDSREAARIAADPQVLAREFASGRHDTWHLSGHAEPSRGTDADRAGVPVERFFDLTPDDLRGKAENLGLSDPLIFFNACHTSRGGHALGALGGWPKRFLDCGAAAFVGAQWKISSRQARAFAEAFYRQLFEGAPIGQAVRSARLAVRKGKRGDSSWLAYSVFAHPAAALVQPLLEVPERRLLECESTPGMLLRADAGVVPFHGREHEVADFLEWSDNGRPLAVRLLTGEGGMGKTRLAIEIARILAGRGWQSGFVPRSLAGPATWWSRVRHEGSPVFMVVDYAEHEAQTLLPLLRECLRRRAERVRFLLLARNAFDWWDELLEAGDEVGDLLQGPATAVRSLGPLASSDEARQKTFRVAVEKFANARDRPKPGGPLPNLSPRYFSRVLLIHIAALAAIDGVVVRGEGGLLAYLLRRERRFWRERGQKLGLPSTLIRGIAEAMATFTAIGGVGSEPQAVEIIRHLPRFEDRSRDLLIAVARLLHELYGGESWIEPLRPDLLGEQLVDEEMGREVLGEILMTIALGPRRN